MHGKSDQPTGTHPGRRRAAAVNRLGTAVLGITVASLMWAGPALAASTASAAGDPSSSGTTIAEVDVGAAILLNIITTSFILEGVPGDTPQDLGAVTMHVLSNNSTGYSVTVQPAAAVLVGTGSNTDTIPVGDLSVRESASGTYQPLVAGTPVQVYTQAFRSVGNPGDLLSNDYEFNTGIPDVHSDTYSVTLDYVASTNP